MQKPRPTPCPASPNAAAAIATRTLPSKDLLGGSNTVRIEHAGEFYQLRLTRSGKLILTK
jgi:hemin uptake protein HemP